MLDREAFTRELPNSIDAIFYTGGVEGEGGGCPPIPRCGSWSGVKCVERCSVTGCVSVPADGSSPSAYYCEGYARWVHSELQKKWPHAGVPLLFLNTSDTEAPFSVAPPSRQEAAPLHIHTQRGNDTPRTEEEHLSPTSLHLSEHQTSLNLPLTGQHSSLNLPRYEQQTSINHPFHEQQTTLVHLSEQQTSLPLLTQPSHPLSQQQTSTPYAFSDQHSTVSPPTKGEASQSEEPQIACLPSADPRVPRLPDCSMCDSQVTLSLSPTTTTKPTAHMRRHPTLRVRLEGEGNLTATYAGQT